MEEKQEEAQGKKQVDYDKGINQDKKKYGHLFNCDSSHMFIILPLKIITA